MPRGLHSINARQRMFSRWWMDLRGWGLLQLGAGIPLRVVPKVFLNMTSLSSLRSVEEEEDFCCSKVSASLLWIQANKSVGQQDVPRWSRERQGFCILADNGCSGWHWVRLTGALTLPPTMSDHASALTWQRMEMAVALVFAPMTIHRSLWWHWGVSSILILLTCHDGGGTSYC